MNPDLYAILFEIREVQAKRRKNFAGKEEPKDADLEKRHQTELEQLRAKLS